MKYVALFLVSLSATGSCLCACIDGEARTVCSDVEAARNTPGRCLPDFRCPGMQEDRPIARYPSPGVGALNCRDAWIWSNTDEGYATRLKICDTIPAD